MTDTTELERRLRVFLALFDDRVDIYGVSLDMIVSLRDGIDALASQRERIRVLEGALHGLLYSAQGTDAAIAALAGRP